MWLVTNICAMCTFIYRNFDDGISECGLVCPKSILALDDRLDRHYGSDSKGRPIDTRFPCY